MVSKRVVAALFLSQLLAGVALAQSVLPPAGASIAVANEFGRVSGGEIDLLTKHSNRLSGSFGFVTSRSQFPFATVGSGAGRGYDATLGGAVLQDRLWFFASAQKTDALASRFERALPQTASSTAASSRRIDAGVNAQIGDRQTLATSFAAARDAGVMTPFTTVTSAPASFLSLRYTGIVSSNMFFNATVSRRSAVQSELPFAIQP